MKVLIVEDETAAVVNLRSMLGRIEPGAEVVGAVESVADTVAWLNDNPAPDLIFMDIHLADGQAFRIFDQVEVTSVVIFATAYDEYALEAFKVNSIDYLLKPIKEEELRRAVDKFKRFAPAERAEYAGHTSAHLSGLSGRGATTFLVYVKDKLRPLGTEEIAFFYIFEDKVWAYTFEGEKLPLDKSLDTIAGMLSENDFFRANRQFIASRKAIKDMTVWFGSRLSLNLTVTPPERIIISRAKVSEFKRWLSER